MGLLSIIIIIVEILVVLAFLYGLFYAFNKYVSPTKPIDGKLVNIFLFIAFALLLLYFLAGHSGRFW